MQPDGFGLLQGCATAGLPGHMVQPTPLKGRRMGVGEKKTFNAGAAGPACFFLALNNCKQNTQKSF